MLLCYNWICTEVVGEKLHLIFYLIGTLFHCYRECKWILSISGLHFAMDIGLQKYSDYIGGWSGIKIVIESIVQNGINWIGIMYCPFIIYFSNAMNHESISFVPALSSVSLPIDVPTKPNHTLVSMESLGRSCIFWCCPCCHDVSMTTMRWKC